MSFKDLRSFLQFLENKGDLVRIKEEVSPIYEITKIESEYDGKSALLFERVKGSRVPVAANIFFDRDCVAHGLGLQKTQLTEAIIRASKNPIKANKVNTGPVKEVINKKVDLPDFLPLPKHFEKDVGRYISGGVIIARDIETGVRNVSFARMWVKEKDRIVVMINFYRHLYQFLQKAESRGRPLEVAIVIGPDPVVWLEGGMSDRLVPGDIDELEVASSLAKKPIDVVKCETIDLEVPANAEIVIEGEFLPGIRESEGPLGDFSRVYDTPPRLNPVIKVKAITHREDPIFLDCLPGSMENFLLGGIPREADLLGFIRNATPCVRAIHLTPGGCCRFHAVVQIDKQYDYEPYHTIIAVLSPSEASRDIKWVVVVDKDIDPTDASDVEWAIATRVRWDQDLTIIPKMASTLDPSSKGKVPANLSLIYGAKVGMDATIPLDHPEYIEFYQKTGIPRGPNIAEIKKKGR